MSLSTAVRPGSVVHGPTLPEPVEVLAVIPLGGSLKIIGRGLHTGLTHDPVLTPEQLAQAVQKRFGLQVHPRSIQRRLLAEKKRR